MAASDGEGSRVFRERDFRWQGVTEEAYKAEGTHFSGARRQTLVGAGAGGVSPGFETRYFEVDPGGYTSLEYHEHAHVVIIVRGRAEVVLGGALHAVEPIDCLYIAPNELHQLHATGEEPLGFLCIVDGERDRPRRPDAETLARLCADPALAQRIRT